jgi:SAM-dependent methyltransferase
VTQHDSRIAEEVAHGRRLSSERPEIWFWSTPAGQRREERRTRMILEHGRFVANEKLLEIGCGVGNFTGQIHAAVGADIVAVDVSPDLLEEARARVPGVRFEVADVHRLAYADAAFDAVYGSSILHHLEIETALREILRVLRPGGRMVFAEPNMLNPQVFVIKNVPWVKRRMHETPHETAFVRWSLAGLLSRTGFVAVRVSPFDFLHPHVPRRLIGAVERLGRVLEWLPLVREVAGSCLIYAEKPARERA